MDAHLNKTYVESLENVIVNNEINFNTLCMSDMNAITMTIQMSIMIIML